MLARALVVVLYATVLAFAGCNRSESKLVGTWRYEDEDNIEELTLNPDRSFRSVTSYKQILATPSVPTEIGTWQMQGNQIAFDATLTFDKTKRQFKRMLSEVKKDSFVMMNLGDRKTVTYKRCSLPTCTGSTVSDTQSMREGDVLGLWEYHYNTHDYQFRFESNRRYELLGFIDGKWDSLHKGDWSLASNQLTWQPDKRPYADDKPQTWKIMQKGADCLTMSDGHSPLTILRRLK